MAYRSRSREQEINDRFQAWLGTAMMLTASVFAILIFCDRMEMRMFSMPAFWDTSRGMHLILCCGMFLFAAILLKSPPESDETEPTTPLFRTCELLTRPGCELCDDAMAVLISFQNATAGHYHDRYHKRSAVDATVRGINSGGPAGWPGPFSRCRGSAADTANCRCRRHPAAVCQSRGR